MMNECKKKTGYYTAGECRRVISVLRLDICPRAKALGTDIKMAAYITLRPSSAV